MKHSFGLSNGSNSRNGSENVILMEEVDSSDIQQKIQKTCFSTTCEKNNYNAIKDHSYTTKHSNNSTEQYNNGMKEEHQNEEKNNNKKKPVIILGDS